MCSHHHHYPDQLVQFNADACVKQVGAEPVVTCTFITETVGEKIWGAHLRCFSLLMNVSHHLGKKHILFIKCSLVVEVKRFHLWEGTLFLDSTPFALKRGRRPPPCRGQGSHRCDTFSDTLRAHTRHTTSSSDTLCLVSTCVRASRPAASRPHGLSY